MLIKGNEGFPRFPSFPMFSQVFQGLLFFFQIKCPLEIQQFVRAEGESSFVLGRRFKLSCVELLKEYFKGLGVKGKLIR